MSSERLRNDSSPDQPDPKPVRVINLNGEPAYRNLGAILLTWELPAPVKDPNGEKPRHGHYSSAQEFLGIHAYRLMMESPDGRYYLHGAYQDRPDLNEFRYREIAPHQALDILMRSGLEKDLSPTLEARLRSQLESRFESKTEPMGPLPTILTVSASAGEIRSDVEGLAGAIAGLVEVAKLQDSLGRSVAATAHVACVHFKPAYDFISKLRDRGLILSPAVKLGPVMVNLPAFATMAPVGPVEVYATLWATLLLIGDPEVAYDDGGPEYPRIDEAYLARLRWSLARLEDLARSIDGAPQLGSRPPGAVLCSQADVAKFLGRSRNTSHLLEDEKNCETLDFAACNKSRKKYVWFTDPAKHAEFVAYMGKSRKTDH